MLKSFWQEDPLVTPNDNSLFKVNRTGNDSTGFRDSRYEE